MDLSVDLISQFVKITNDKSKAPKESVVYGTAVKYGGATYVKLDGSDMLTPINTTVDVKETEEDPDGNITDGERISVTIRNHTAIATGNASSPAARIDTVIAIDDRVKYIEADYAKISTLEAEFVSTKELEAEKAEIEELVATKATIEDLNAATGRIDTLESDYAKIDEIYATKATIESLDSKYIDTEELNATKGDIETLISKKADIEELNAVEGNIDTLNSEVGNIKNLYATNATVDNLLADKANVSDLTAINGEIAALKVIDGNIQNLVADKADINLANVKTADVGTLLANVGLISDATIKDGHVTGYLDSVEINANDITAGTLTVDRLVLTGTDKSLVYTLNNSGDLISTEVDTLDGDVITKRTITADHIVGKSITANEIAGGTITGDLIASKTIEAGHITANSLESISANIGAFKIAGALTTNGHTAYNSAVHGVYVGSDYISLGNGGKTWLKADGSASIGDGAITYNATNNKLDISANSINIEAKGIDSIMQEQIDGIEIGGRNLWIESQVTKHGSITEEDLGENHITGQKTCYKLTNEFDSFLQLDIEPEYSSRLFRTVTFSAWVKYDNVVVGANSWNAFNIFKHVLYFKNSQTGAESNVSYMTLETVAGTADNPASSDWKKVVYTYDYTRNTSYDQLRTELRIRLETPTSGTAWVTGIKVEFGDKATEWTPAPEDMASTSWVSSQIDVTNEQITLSVSDINEDISRLDNKIDTNNTAYTSEINLLKDSIEHLVVDKDGQSLMKQTSTGWTFSTGDIQNEIDDVTETTNALTEKISGVTEWVHVGTHTNESGETEPCIELGETDSSLKLTITNTKMSFTDGGTDMAYFDNQSLHIDKAVIEDELQQGGFVWKKRSNNNMGLVWKGE